MSKQIDEAVASGTHKYVSSKLHAKLYQVTNLLLVALRPALNRQVKTGCPCPPLEAPPGTWYTIYGPALRLATKLEHVSWVGLGPHDHVDLCARGDGRGRR